MTNFNPNQQDYELMQQYREYNKRRKKLKIRNIIIIIAAIVIGLAISSFYSSKLVNMVINLQPKFFDDMTEFVDFDSNVSEHIVEDKYAIKDDDAGVLKKKVKYEGRTYEVYAYEFDDVKSSQEYFENCTGKKTDKFLDLSLKTKVFSKTQYVAFYNGNIYRIEGGSIFKTAEFLKYLNSDFTINLANVSVKIKLDKAMECLKKEGYEYISTSEFSGNDKEHIEKLNREKGTNARISVVGEDRKIFTYVTVKDRYGRYITIREEFLLVDGIYYEKLSMNGEEDVLCKKRMDEIEIRNFQNSLDPFPEKNGSENENKGGFNELEIEKISETEERITFTLPDEEMSKTYKKMLCQLLGKYYEEEFELNNLRYTVTFKDNKFSKILLSFDYKDYDSSASYKQELEFVYGIREIKAPENSDEYIEVN